MWKKTERKQEKKPSKVKEFITTKMVPYFGKIGTQKHLLGIRNGIVAALPMILVGSLFTIILNFPIGSEATDTVSKVLPAELKQMFDLINRFTFGLMALYIAIGIGSELARMNRLSSTQGAIMGAFGYLLWMATSTISFAPLNAQQIADLNLNQEQLTAMMGLNGQVSLFNGGIWLNIKNLGAGTVFVAMVASTLTIEVYRVCVKHNITIRMPKEVPTAVSNSFLTLVPIFFVALVFGLLHYVIGFDLANFLTDALKPMGDFLVSNLFGAIMIVFLIAFLWWFGIHGGSLVQSITRPFWLIALEENKTQFEAGEKVSNTFVEPFFQWFAQMGGAGNTLGLVVVAAIFAKSKGFKTIAATSVVPGIFNINEPILFGLPIILNPFMFIPFVFGPVISVIVGWIMQIALGVHWVAMAPWTLPGPIGAFLASGNQWQAIIANLVVIGATTAVWTPFVLVYDRFLLKSEKIEETLKSQPQSQPQIQVQPATK